MTNSRAVVTVVATHRSRVHQNGNQGRVVAKDTFIGQPKDGNGQIKDDEAKVYPTAACSAITCCVWESNNSLIHFLENEIPNSLIAY